MTGIEGRTGKALLTTGTQEKELCNPRVEEVDEIEVDNRKRKRQDSASPLSRLIRRRVLVAVLTTDDPQ